MFKNKCMLNKLIEYIDANKLLLTKFSKIYVFGSLIKNKSMPNDIDMLLVYKKYSQEIIDTINIISIELHTLTGEFIDLTVMSIAELKQTNFLKRMGNCLKLK